MASVMALVNNCRNNAFDVLKRADETTPPPFVQPEFKSYSAKRRSVKRKFLVKKRTSAKRRSAK